MEGATVAANSLLTSITNLRKTGNEQESIAAFIRNFISADTVEEMAIKESSNDNFNYTVPVKQSTDSNERMKSLQEAKEAFLNSTIEPNNKTLPLINPRKAKDVDRLHYAQIAITTGSDDTRSTGGGEHKKRLLTNEIPAASNTEILKKRIEQQHRKVSFKIKNASTSHRRPPIATRTMTISGNKVSELTKKFNDLVRESHNGSVKSSKLVKTIEDLQAASLRSGSASSTPSSTLSSSPNIKIVLRNRRGSKKRHGKKRCSSVDSIDKLILSENGSAKIRILRSKSDGNRIPKSPKKRLKYQDSSSQPSGSDSVDGSPVKPKTKTEQSNRSPTRTNVVKNVIRKFECEISQTNVKPLTKNSVQSSKANSPQKEKPKVPEKKSSLVLTKNVVVKDGVPKIRIIKPPPIEISKHKIAPELPKKESIYDKRKYKTNYIHSDKMPLHVVEIIHEDVNENKTSQNEVQEILNSETVKTEDVNPDNSCLDDEEKPYEDINSPQITPNESFLWRRKSSTQIYSDSDKSFSDSAYSLFSVNTVTEKPISQDESYYYAQSKVIEKQTDNCGPPHDTSNNDSNSDFETNLVEAYNPEVMRGFTIKPKKEVEIEDDYEPLEPLDLPVEVVEPPKRTDRKSITNCPLPEIPKEKPQELYNKAQFQENIYQCLLEMRSHPEGDDSSLHSYELCDNQMEDRTPGDGDSDNGYEYCKSPVKPYCHTSSTGIQIAEDYQPYSKENQKYYLISKSVSGTSTVSYEKIGSERIYEKIPSIASKSKDNSPTSYSNRHSFVSSDYTSYNDGENIYDTIKHSDGVSLSHCYESIPNSPSMVVLRNNFKKQLASAVQKRLSFDTVSNISQSTLSSEQKTNSIYGQRSVISYNGQEVNFQVPSSETSVSDRSDKSDEWVDVSDEEKTEEQKIVIVRERSRGRKSPISWSQKVRHQWQKTPSKPKAEHKEGDSSDSGHLYESLEPVPAPLDDDFDSFDSDTDDEPLNDQAKTPTPQVPAINLERLPEPPSGGGQYTLTKIASAAQRKMRQLKRNLTKRYTIATDGKALHKTALGQQNGETDTKSKSPIYANYQRPEIQHLYSNINFNEPKMPANKVEGPVPKINGFKEDLKNVIYEKRMYGEIPPPLPEKMSQEKPLTPISDSKKDNGTLSRKAYFSFKSRFRRATSMAIDINSDVPSALKITNSTFYLTDSMDGDSGFSNCSEPGQTGSSEALPTSPAGGLRRGRRGPLSDSSPCLARPAMPPPPPPPAANELGAVNEELKRLLPTLSKKEKAVRTRTSWYAECGVTDECQSPGPSSTSWYAEAGLYQAGNISTSSGASSGSQPASPLPHSLFTHEPLYQFYNAAKLESVCRETIDSDSDAYDASGGSVSGGSGDSGGGGITGSGVAASAARPSAMTLAAPRGPARTLWCEVPEVIASAVLSSLAPAQKRLQEAKFELLTSEASYLNSLNVLDAHFMSHPAFRDPHVLPSEDRELLFSTISPVRKCSQQLMQSLEKCWQDNILLQGICDIVRDHAQRHFAVYVKYCENQALMVKALQRLRERPAFSAVLRRLEGHPSCQSLSLHSFLLLPMQRVTRLPLLLDAVLRHVAPADHEYQGCVDALATLNHFVSQCNEGARTTERVEEMARLSRLIEFPTHMADHPLLGPACSRRDRKPVRWLVRSGEMTQLIWKTDELKLTFGKKFHKIPLHLFLFNDLLVITKKKSDSSYVCVDYCARPLIEVCPSDGVAQSHAKHTILLTLLENHEARTVEMLMSCATETDASRWGEALSPPAGGEEAVYAGWDCPQVAALYAYAPAQPDELGLTQGDVVNVTRKTSEGWYYGERIRDGESGWFPGAYTAEIASPHVRARNLRQRYRLLALSGTYLGQKKKGA